MGRPRINPAPDLLPETQRFSELIEELGFSRREFALRLGMSPSGLGTLFQRGAPVSVVLAKAVECEFGVNHQWLLSGQEPKWSKPESALRLSEQWLLEILGRIGRLSRIAQVELPFNLAVGFFQQELLKFQQELVAYQLGRHSVMDQLFDWQQNIALWLRGDWQALQQEVNHSSDMQMESDNAAASPGGRSQPRQWQTARYYYMDITVMEETKRPSSEAKELGIEIDQAWIDERRQRLHQRWHVLKDNVHQCFQNEQTGWLSVE